MIFIKTFFYAFLFKNLSLKINKIADKQRRLQPQYTHFKITLSLILQKTIGIWILVLGFGDFLHDTHFLQSKNHRGITRHRQSTSNAQRQIEIHIFFQ